MIGSLDDYSPHQLIEAWERINVAAIEVLALVQGPLELADALVELARQQSQKRPVPATARSALDAWRCRSAGSAEARGCIGAGGLGPQR